MHRMHRTRYELVPENKNSIMKLINAVDPLATAGLILSLYALYVESKLHDEDLEEEFVALCDIEAIGASCRCVYKDLYFRTCLCFRMISG